MKPVGKTVIVELVERAQDLAANVRARSGLLIATKKLVQGMPDRGLVIAVGSEVENPEFVVGDTVIFKHQENFQGFEIDGKKLAGIPSKDIVATLREDHNA